MSFNLPKGAEAGFKIELRDVFDASFAIHLYGAGRKGWFTARIRDLGQDSDRGPQPLEKGGWRTFLNLVKQGHFWDLSESWPHPIPTNVVVDDGEYLEIRGRDAWRYHVIHRANGFQEPGLSAVLAFGRRAADLSPPPLPSKKPERNFDPSEGSTPDGVER